MRQTTKLLRAVALADQLVTATRDVDNRAHKLALKLARSLRPKVSMSEILVKVPGASVTDQAETVGVSRQTWYNWLDGKGRPHPGAAKRLAKITGVSEEVIRGR